MSEYRIIFNAHGFVPQRRRWYGWDGVTKSGKWYSEVLRCDSVEEARSVIDADIERRSLSTEWQEGAVVEIYSPLYRPKGTTNEH